MEVQSRGVGDNNNGLDELRDQFHNLLVFVVERPSLKGVSLLAWMGKQLNEKILHEVFLFLSLFLSPARSFPLLLSFCVAVSRALSLSPAMCASLCSRSVSVSTPD